MMNLATLLLGVLIILGGALTDHVPLSSLLNLTAFIIVMLLTVVLVRGIKESARTNNFMVLFKIIAILIFVGFTMRLIHPANWHPFAPNGWPGILTGGSIFFFTYIGFDSVSTAAEECKQPQKDSPLHWEFGHPGNTKRRRQCRQ